MSKSSSPFGIYLKEKEFFNCCTSFYESDLVKYMLGESFHPGGLALTFELIDLIKISPGEILIDLACGLGSTLKEISSSRRIFGIGIDLSFNNLQKGQHLINRDKVICDVSFIQADVHHLPFRSNSTNAVISECSFCIFFNKYQTASEIYRLLQTNGIFAFSDVVKLKDWPQKMNEIFYRIACISDARSQEDYAQILSSAGFQNIHSIDKKQVILDLHSSLKKKTLMLNITAGMNRFLRSKFDLSHIDFKELNKSIDLVKEFTNYNYGSYLIMSGTKSTIIE